MIRRKSKQDNKKNMVSIRYQLVSVYLSVSALLLVFNFVLFYNVNKQMQSMDEVYVSNQDNSKLEETLGLVQNYMTDYMMTKSTSSLEAYYIAVSDLQEQARAFRSDQISSVVVVEQNNIANMIDSYLELTDKAIASKRGRNMRVYRENHDKATQIYGYITSYIYALNNEQFQTNNENFNNLIAVTTAMENASVILLVLMVIVGVSISYLMTQRLTRPLANLVQSASEISAGNFETEIENVSSSQEIYILTDAFNRMVSSIRKYIEVIKLSIEKERDLKEKELIMEAELKDAQLKYFQAQISPHFLFNTLNAGAQLAMMEEADRTYNFINNLADFFRYNIQTSDVTTLKDELNLVDKYIYILNVRFAGELTLIKDIDESLTGVIMPTMIMQPFVENSVNYGLRNIDWEKKIYISVYGKDDEVLVSIADNGIGIEPDRIEGIMNGTIVGDEKNPDSNGVGIPNVAKRLDLFYKTEHSVEMLSEGVNQGTEVIIHLKK